MSLKKQNRRSIARLSFIYSNIAARSVQVPQNVYLSLKRLAKERGLSVEKAFEQILTKQYSRM